MYLLAVLGPSVVTCEFLVWHVGASSLAQDGSQVP